VFDVIPIGILITEKDDLENPVKMNSFFEKKVLQNHEYSP